MVEKQGRKSFGFPSLARSKTSSLKLPPERGRPDQSVPFGCRPAGRNSDPPGVIRAGFLLGRRMLDSARLRRIVSYDPETGVFTRAGKVAGCRQSAGYTHVRIEGERYLAHRLAWMYVTGEWPDGDIDHANGVRSDNRWVNLRLATRSQNNANMKVNGRNLSGLKGVKFDKRDGRFYAAITIDRKTRRLGGYATAELAHAAYFAAAKEVYGDFARSA